MKTLTIYERTITERGTGGWFNPITKTIIIYGDKTYNLSNEDMKNPKFKVPYRKVFQTRKRSEIEKYASFYKNKRSYDYVQIRKVLEEVLKDGE